MIMIMIINKYYKNEKPSIIFHILIYFIRCMSSAHPIKNLKTYMFARKIDMELYFVVSNLL